MQIIRFEQSGMIIESESGFRLAVDIGSKTHPKKLDDVHCDEMLISHIHPDHFSLEHITALNPHKVYLNRECIDTLQGNMPTFDIVEITSSESMNMGDINVSIFDVDHGPNVSKLKENFGFLFKVDGQTIYFAGDMFYPSGLDASTLEVDFAYLPVGTFYTFGPAEAVGFAKQFKRIGQVLPMHYEPHPETREQFIKLAVTEGLNTERSIIV